MRRKNILALLCILLAGVCVMGIVKTQAPVYGQGVKDSFDTTDSMEEETITDSLGEQKLKYESATVYYPSEEADAEQSCKVSHTYIPNP